MYICFCVCYQSSRENQELSKSEMLKGDIEQYVKRKISCLPKCGLEQVGIFFRVLRGSGSCKKLKFA